MSKRRVVWLTDIHFEFLTPPQIDTFLETVRACQPDVVLICGDIGQAKTLRTYLVYIARSLLVPVCFVLGNHDFYGGDIASVRAQMYALTQEQSGATWLPAVDLIELAPEVGLIGHDGWSDGRYGNYHKSDLMLNDYVLIKSLKNLSFEQRLEKLNQLGDESAAYLRRVLPRAITHYKHIFVMLHPPPFREAFYHEGKPVKATSPFVPHFTCKAVGDVLLEIAKAHSSHQFTVLCGHTHGQAHVELLENLTVKVGGAEYYAPEIQQVFAL